MRFLQVVRSYLPKYKRYLIIYIILLIVSAVLSVFSFAAIIPILKILFGISDQRLEYTDLGGCDSFSDILDAVKNNIFYHLQEQISVQGADIVLIWLCVFLIITSLLNNVTSYFGYYFRIPIRTGIAKDIRGDLFKKITEISPSYFAKENKGDFVSRMTSDAEEVEFGVASAIDMILENPVSIIVYLATLFSISWQLTLFAVFLLCICCFFVLKVGVYMKDIALKAQAFRGKILAHFEEALSSLRVIKSYNLENKTIDKFENINDNTRKAFNRLNRHYSIAFPFADFLVTTVIAVMLWYGGRYVLQGNYILDASVFVYYLIVFHSIIRPMRSMLKASYAIRKSTASVERIDKILKIKSNITQSEIVQHLKSFDNYSATLPIIEFKDVSFEYVSDNPIIDKLSFSVYKNRPFAIIGRTGVGKTTIAELILRFLDFKSGNINITGIDIKSIPLTELRNAVCYINQEQILFNDTIKNNIVLGNNNYSETELDTATKTAGIYDYIMSLSDGYQTVIGDRGTLLSGGQRQCICIARALLKKSPILIMDEATSALDNKTEQYVLNNIRSLYNDRTLIIISHNASVIDKCEDRIVIGEK